MVKPFSKLQYHVKSGFKHGFKNVIFSKFFFGFIASLSMIISSHDKAGRVKDNLDARFNNQEDTFDFIVVGGGSAGSIVANRLSENHKVLLLEAGGEPHPLQRIPGMAFFMLNHRETDWMHRTVPQRRACFASPNRRSGWSQGRNLGGSGNLNFMVHLRGSPRDYDYWAKITGDDSWSYAGVLPYFRRHENYQGDSPDREAHGFDGELKLEIPSYTGMAKEFIRAGQELGYEHVDLNARYEEGFDTIYCPLEGGERRSSFAAFLDPIRDRDTLIVRKYAHVNKLLIRGFDNTAFGVEYDRHGLRRYAYATKEVIVAAGTVETSKLLMLSGIGPKTHLADLGIPLVANLPVGKNLQDHLATFLGPFFIDPPRAYLIDRDITLKSFYEYKSDGNGPLSTSLFQAAAMISSKHAKQAGVWNWPDIQLLMSGMAGHKTFAKDMAHAFHLNHKTIKKYYEHALGRDSFFIAVSASRPLGRGEIVLEKKDPYAPTSINPRYLENDHDLHIMVEGIKTALYLVENTTSFQNLRARFTSKKFPGCEHMPFRSDDYFECFVRHFSVSMSDPVGTCAMGNPHMGKDGVLDSQLQVIGVHHLRVIDASVMPTIVGSQTESAVMMIAEKGSDMILEAWKTRDGEETTKHPLHPHPMYGQIPTTGPRPIYGPQNENPPNHNPGIPLSYGPGEEQGWKEGNGGYSSYGPPSTSEQPPNSFSFGNYGTKGPSQNTYNGPPPSLNNYNGPPPPQNSYNGPSTPLSNYNGPPPPANNFGNPPSGSYNAPQGNNGPSTPLSNYNGPLPPTNNFGNSPSGSYNAPQGNNGPSQNNYNGPPQNNYNGPPPNNNAGPQTDSYNGPPPSNNNVPNNRPDNYNGPPPPLNSSPVGQYSSPLIGNNNGQSGSYNNGPSKNNNNNINNNGPSKNNNNNDNNNGYSNNNNNNNINNNDNNQGGYSPSQPPPIILTPPQFGNPRQNSPAEDNEMSTTETAPSILPFNGNDPPEENAPRDRENLIESSTNNPLKTIDRATRKSIDIDDTTILTTSESSTSSSVFDPLDATALSFIQDEYKPSKFDDDFSSENKSIPSALRPDVTLLTHDTKMRPGLQVSNPFPDMYYGNLADQSTLSPVEFRLKYPITSTVEYSNKIPNPPELGPVYFRNPEYTTRKPFLYGNATSDREADDPPGYNASVTAAARTIALSNVPEYRPYNDRSRQPHEGSLQPHVVFKSNGASNKIPSTANVPNPYYTMKDQSSMDAMSKSESAGTPKEVEIPSPYWLNASPRPQITENQVSSPPGNKIQASSVGEKSPYWTNASPGPLIQESDSWKPMDQSQEPNRFASGSANVVKVKKPRAKIIGYKRKPKSETQPDDSIETHLSTTSATTTTSRPKKSGRIIRIKNPINWATTAAPLSGDDSPISTSTSKPETSTTTHKMKVKIRLKNRPETEIEDTDEQDTNIQPYFNQATQSPNTRRPRIKSIGQRGANQVPTNTISGGPVTITPRPLLSVTIWPDDIQEDKEPLIKLDKPRGNGDGYLSYPDFVKDSDEDQNTRTNSKVKFIDRKKPYGQRGESFSYSEPKPSSSNLISTQAGELIQSFGGNSGDTYLNDNSGHNDNIKQETHNHFHHYSTTSQPFTQNNGYYNQHLLQDPVDYGPTPSRLVSQVPKFYAQDSPSTFVRPPFHIDQNDPATFGRIQENRDKQEIIQTQTVGPGQYRHESLPWEPSLRLTPSPEDGTQRPRAFSSVIRTRYTEIDNRFPTSFREVPLHSVDTTTPVNVFGPPSVDESPLQYGQATPVGNTFDQSPTARPDSNSGQNFNRNRRPNKQYQKSKQFNQSVRNLNFGSSTPRPFETNLNSPFKGNENYLNFQNQGNSGSQSLNQNTEQLFNDHSSFASQIGNNHNQNAVQANNNNNPTDTTYKNQIKDSHWDVQNFDGNSQLFSQALQNSKQNSPSGQISESTYYNNANQFESNIQQTSDQANLTTQPDQVRYPNFHDDYSSSQNSNTFNQNPATTQTNEPNTFNENQNTNNFQQHSNNFDQNSIRFQSQNKKPFKTPNQPADTFQTTSTNEHEQSLSPNIGSTANTQDTRNPSDATNGFNNPSFGNDQNDFRGEPEGFQPPPDRHPGTFGNDKTHLIENTGIDTGKVSLTYEDTGSLSLLDQPVVSNPDDPKSKSNTIDTSQISLTNPNSQSHGQFNTDIQFPQFGTQGQEAQSNDQNGNFDGFLTNQNSEPSWSTSTTPRALVFGSRLNRDRNRDPLSNFGETLPEGFGSENAGFTEQPPDFNFGLKRPDSGPGNLNGDYQTFVNTERPLDTFNPQGFNEFQSTNQPPRNPYVTSQPSFTPNKPQEYTIFSNPDSIDITNDFPNQFSHLRRRADILQQRRRKRRRNFMKVFGGGQRDDEDEDESPPFRRRPRRPHSRRHKHRTGQTPFGQRRSSFADEEEFSEEEVAKSRDIINGLTGMNDPAIYETVRNSTQPSTKVHTKPMNSNISFTLTSRPKIVTNPTTVLVPISNLQSEEPTAVHEKSHISLLPSPNLGQGKR